MIYAKEIKHAPDWHQLAFKALGASRLARCRFDEVTDWLRRMDNDQAAANFAESKARTRFFKERNGVKDGPIRNAVGR